MSKKVYIIAEAGVNHNGSMDLAKQLIDVAAEAGADAVKFQTFKADNLVSKAAAKASYQLANTDQEESQYDMIKRLELDEAAHVLLIDYCHKKKIEFLSTPFDEHSLILLSQKFKLSKIKIPSGEITNAPFLLEIARQGKPVILSTGMSSLAEIEMALGVLAFGFLKNNEAPSQAQFENAYASAQGQECLQKNVMLLHCTTEYPAPLSDVNLNVLKTLEVAFKLPVGYSDHTQGIAVSIAATALGAAVIEKHFTLDKNLPGPDHKASLTPLELKEMIKSIREVELALGSSLKKVASSELKNRNIARKSLMAKKAIKKGELFTVENLTSKRPGNGISPHRFWEYLGEPAAKDYDKEELIK